MPVPGGKMIYILLIITLISDLLIFKGPLLIGIGLISSLILFLISVKKKKNIKKHGILFLIFLMFEITIILSGNYLNKKIKYEAEQIYKNIDQYTFKTEDFNGAKITKFETKIYNNTLSVYKSKSKYTIHVRLYNFSSATFEEGHWIEEQDD